MILLLFKVLPPAAAEIGVDASTWFNSGISYASIFEVVLVSLALVYYASDMPDGKSDIIEYCQGIVNDSPDYQGHDHRWSAPNSWRYARQFQLVQARQRITDAMSMRHKGGDVQAIEHVAYHTYGVTLVATDVNEYKRRLVLGPKDKQGGRKPLLDPSRTSKHPKFCLVGMLPVIARTVIVEYRVRPLRCAPPTSSPLVAGRGLHAWLTPKSSAQAPCHFLEAGLPTTYSNRTRIFKSLLKVNRRFVEGREQM